MEQPRYVSLKGITMSRAADAALQVLLIYEIEHEQIKIDE